MTSIAELLLLAASAEPQQEELVPRRKTKKGRKKRTGSKSPSCQPSPPPTRPSSSYRPISPLTRPPAITPTPPTARLERPFSAAPPTIQRSTYSLGPARPASAGPRQTYVSPYAAPKGTIKPQSSIPRPHSPLGKNWSPEWDEKTAPKYTADSKKVPELGSAPPPPGHYQSPPWKPSVQNERDPSRLEINQPVNDVRFKHVLAVPAHVLAQSFYHPDTPGAVARNKQLQEDLKVARMDRKLAVQEKQQALQQLKTTSMQLADSQHALGALQAEQQALQQQVQGLQATVGALSAENERLRRELRAAQGSACVIEAAELRVQLAASRAEGEKLRQELRKALQQSGR